jgi:hypothetical protein
MDGSIAARGHGCRLADFKSTATQYQRFDLIAQLGGFSVLTRNSHVPDCPSP